MVIAIRAFLRQSHATQPFLNVRVAEQESGFLWRSRSWWFCYHNDLIMAVRVGNSGETYTISPVDGTHARSEYNWCAECHDFYNRYDNSGRCPVCNPHEEEEEADEPFRLVHRDTSLRNLVGEGIHMGVELEFRCRNDFQIENMAMSGWADVFDIKSDATVDVEFATYDALSLDMWEATAEKWQRFFATLKERNFYVDRTCGLHIHIGGAHMSETQRKKAYFLAGFLRRRESSSYAAYMDESRIPGDINLRRYTDKYIAVARRYSTIEFRCFDGVIEWPHLRRALREVQNLILMSREFTIPQINANIPILRDVLQESA